ncbi:MAG TPA: DNA translocase FtsK 4TM domain-containing protein, partial [Verrucomicrobiae bacterium]|nr:DNA translocase FtsK 4TM domain-containing protein [Verrucomicrobiae bacterium]
MSRKTPAGPGNGLNDIIGVALLAAAMLLLVAQVSFDRGDLAFIHTPPNKPIHNWIGPFGAHVAYASFFLFGLGGFVLPFLLAAFGLGYLFNFLGYLRERRIWSLVWGVVMMLSLTGLLHILNRPLRQLCVNINAPSAGGWFGYFTYDYGFWMLGAVGATIVYATLYLISLLFLTDFRLGDWVRRWFEKPEVAKGAAAEETALDRRARELEKQAKKLQEEVARSGLGADMQPVPEPTVRDLSVPSAKSARGKKAPGSETAK